jgi:hypothetical protein
MVRHFTSKKEAINYMAKQNKTDLHIYRKLKGHLNRIKKPFVVCSYIEWVNLY